MLTCVVFIQSLAEIRLEWIQLPRFSPETTIEVTTSNWFNPLMNYKHFMVPGILVVLVTMVGLFLASLNIVREKEIGTIEQINVTPVKKYHFIIGKPVPSGCWVGDPSIIAVIALRMVLRRQAVYSPFIVLLPYTRWQY